MTDHGTEKARLDKAHRRVSVRSAMSRSIAAFVIGAALAKVAEKAAPVIAQHPAVREGRARTQRALHVLRGRSLVYGVTIDDGTVLMPAQHSRIENATLIGGPPRVAMEEVEAIFAEALERAQAAVHQTVAVQVGPRFSPDHVREEKADD